MIILEIQLEFKNPRKIISHSLAYVNTAYSLLNSNYSIYCEAENFRFSTSHCEDTSGVSV